MLVTTQFETNHQVAEVVLTNYLIRPDSDPSPAILTPTAVMASPRFV